MKTKPSLLLRLWLAALALALGCLPSVSAQAPATGTISGRVFEGATGRSLQGATVRATGTNAFDYTDQDGRFTLNGVPVGTASVEVEYVGLDLFKQTVAVSAGAIATLNPELKSEVLKMQAFEVAEAARGQALAINQQKTGKGIVNIVSEEVFGAMNDGNIGFALARLPGLTVSEGEDGTPEGVNIRGLASEFNSFQLDGNRLSMRGFNTRDLVADGISNIEVIKAATPDRDGDALGGTINVVSRSAFQREGQEIKIAASANYLGLAEKWGHNLKATYTNLFGVFGQEKNLGVSGTISKYLTNRYYENNDSDWTLINPEFNPTYNLPGFPFYYNPNLTEQFNLRESKSYAINTAFDFRIDKQNTFYFRPLYSHQDIVASRYLSRPYIDTRFENTLTGRKTFEFLRTGEGRGTAGANGSRGQLRYSGEESETAFDLYSFAAGGRHEMANSSTLTYDLFYKYQHSYRDVDSDFIVRNNHQAKGYFQWQYDTRNPLKPKVWVVNGIDPRDLSGVVQGNLSIEPEDRHESVYQGKIDWEKKFVGERMSTAIKFGGKYAETQAKFQQDQFEYRTTATFPYASVMKPSTRSINGREMWMEVEPAKVRALLKSNPSLFPLLAYESAVGSAEEDYDAKETSTAAYGMGTAQIGKTTIIGGLRMERNTWAATTKKVDARTIRVAEVNNGRSYTEWLPGLHGRHALQPNTILRASYNRSYSRPSLSRLTYGRIEDSGGNIIEGNPNLNPTTSQNLDAQLERYTQTGGLYSIGLFYKKMQGFYYQSDLRFNDVDAEGTPIVVGTGLRRWRKYENSKGAVNMGAEFIVQQKLNFLPQFLKGFAVNASATLSDSKAEYPNRPEAKYPTFGFSDTMYNVALDYSRGSFRGNIRYSFRSDYLTGLGENKYIDDQFAAREQVDVEASYRVTRKFRINANVINLTSRPQVSYQSFPQYVEDNSLSGWRATVGVDYTF